eukprot:1705244-Rhodomonas_salina.1
MIYWIDHHSSTAQHSSSRPTAPTFCQSLLKLVFAHACPRQQDLDFASSSADTMGALHIVSPRSRGGGHDARRANASPPRLSSKSTPPSHPRLSAADVGEAEAERFGG